MPAWVALYVALVAPAMAVPFKNHWWPVVALDVNVGDSVLVFDKVTVGLAGLMQKLLSTEVAAL